MIDNVMRGNIGNFFFLNGFLKHLVHIKQTFSKFKNYNLKIQLGKSVILRKEVTLLEEIIMPNRIKPNS